MKLILPILFAAVVVLAACQPKPVFEARHEFPGATWAYRDTVNFDFEIKDTATIYSLWLDFEHADSIPFQNIYLKLSTRFPDGKRPSSIYTFQLLDNEGKTLGEQSGKTFTVGQVLQQHAYFKQAGAYTLTLEQFTRQERYTGMKAVTLRLEKDATPKK